MRCIAGWLLILSLAPAAMPAMAQTATEDITHLGATVRHLGDGVFAVGPDGQRIDLRRIAHAHDPARDPDVPRFTDVTLNDRVPELLDDSGRRHARITLYQIDPPLTGAPSAEAGIDRGTDFRDPANLVQGAYSNYVSPVMTADAMAERVAGHPVGHFLVRVEIPGYPTVLTGMTTVDRADTELVELTLGRELGIGGVLLTPQPGRLNQAAEAAREFNLRQRPLRVVDGLHYRRQGGRNVGPEFELQDGHVVFVRFRIPVENAMDAMAFFAEYLRRGIHNSFGSMLSRPARGTGGVCSAFAMSWLQAAGIIPFVTERKAPANAANTERLDELWMHWQRSIAVPWPHIGCDERVGAGRIVPAQYTVHDLLFHRMTPEAITLASEGLAARVRESYGTIPATLFQWGALTPLRDLLINARRKDPEDRGDYAWARAGEGLEVTFWDNVHFSNWVKRFWSAAPRNPRMILVREGRFRGVEIDAMATPRQREPFFAAADRLLRQRAEFAARDARPMTCQEVFALGLQ